MTRTLSLSCPERTTSRHIATAALGTLVLSGCAGHAARPAPLPAASRPPERARAVTPLPSSLVMTTAAESSSMSIAGPVAAALREYRTRGVAEPVVQGSIVIFPFGHGDPVLTCTVLRACIVELEPGEALVNPPIAGDHVRWLLSSAAAGQGGHSTLIVVKPTDCDLTTNVILSTDRRIYDLTLDSPACPRATSDSTSSSRRAAPRDTTPAGTTSSTSEGSRYNPRQPHVRHIRFYYPDDPAPRERATVAAGAPVGLMQPVAAWREGAATAGPSGPADAAGRLNADWRVTGDRRIPWMPARVVDDGARVFITLHPEAAHQEAPALFALEEDGTTALVNYTVRGEPDAIVYVTDRVFRRGLLVIGEGKAARRVELENRAADRQAGRQADGSRPQGR